VASPRESKNPSTTGRFYGIAVLVIDEVSAFPRGKHDDIVDTLSSCLGFLRRTGLAQLSAEAAEEKTEELRFRGNKRSVADEDGL
jgi:hypothetical protein